MKALRQARSKPPAGRKSLVFQERGHVLSPFAIGALRRGRRWWLLGPRLPCHGLMIPCLAATAKSSDRTIVAGLRLFLHSVLIGHALVNRPQERPRCGRSNHQVAANDRFRTGTSETV